MKVFYSYLLVHYDEILDAVDALNLGRQDHAEAIAIINNTIHHVVIETLLDVLAEEHHERLRIQLLSNPSDQGIFQFIHSTTGTDIRPLLSDRLTRIQLDILEDLLHP